MVLESRDWTLVLQTFPAMAALLITALTLIAFAANSLLCRTALGGHRIDPVSFTTLRLVSGALALLPLSRIFRETRARMTGGSWGSGLALFAYAIAFSLAYISLSTGMGALILFGTVQVTMITAALISGERPHPVQAIGLVAALGGLVYLVFPGIMAPNPMGAVFMGVAGMAWGIYSIRGRGVEAPIAMTAGNFARSAPLAVAASIAATSTVHLEMSGVALALASGIVTSGFGYVLWYKALRHLTTTQASTVQLLVPVLAGFGGVIILSEKPTIRLFVASALILGGVALALTKRRQMPKRTGE